MYVLRVRAEYSAIALGGPRGGTMRAMSLALTRKVSMTLVEEGGCWRFGSWYRHDGSAMVAPCESARDRRFSSAAAAAVFFRALCSDGRAEPRDDRCPARHAWG